jgi:hypothetical protein
MDPKPNTFLERLTIAVGLPRGQRFTTILTSRDAISA